MLRRTSAITVAGLSVLASVAALAPSPVTVQALQPKPSHTQLVPETPRTNVPRIMTGEITDIEYIGNQVFIAGGFTSIQNNTATNKTTVNQQFLASYNIDTGLIDTGFRPTFGGGGVNEIEASPDGTRLYVVGRFNTVNGVAKRKVVALNSTTGAVIAGFTANTNGAATAVDATATTVYVGGQFTTMNGAARVGLAAVSATTGANTAGFLNNLSGGIGVGGALTVQALVLTHDDSKLLVVHTGRQIAGQDRYGVGIINTTDNQLLPWRSRLWEDNIQFIGGIQRAYAAAISPDDSYFVVTSGSGGDRPPVSDTAIRFDFNNGGDNQLPVWVSRLFDSVYSVAISEVAIYLGGHFNFMESPTAPDPWPGLDNVGYGNGQGLGGYGLGDDIVIRDHIGAVSPTTGKALEWSPGSNSFEGNKAMLVTPRGLVAGGDAITQGGQNVGRVAFYDFSTVPAPGANETTIINPIMGHVEVAGEEFVMNGTASAASGVRRVQIEVQERDAKRYLQDDLVTWGPANTINAALSAPNATSTNWSLALNIAGNHRLQVLARTVAVNGSSDATKAAKKFETFGLSDQTPATSVSSPPSGVIPTTTFVVIGTATDDVGVNSLTFTLRDEQNRYLQDDGTADIGFNSFRGFPDVIGATAATWSYEFTVPYEGKWTMQATAVDTAGQSDLRSGDRTWIVSATAITPTVAITTPVVMSPPTANPPLTLAPGAPLTFSGSATDDQGLRNVEITLRNTVTRQNLAADGSWGTNVIAGLFRVSPLDITGSSFNWTYTTPFNLAPGVYAFSVRATDDVGLGTASTNRGSLTINVQVPGDNFPDTTISPTGTQPNQPALQLNLAGTATDDFGVSAVQVSVRDSISSRYVQPDGTMSANFALLDTTLVSPGATGTGWNRVVNLPVVGNYAVTAFAFDTQNQQDPSTTGATVSYPVFPGDLPPTVTEGLLAPTEGSVFTDARIFVSGRFEDDQQMARGQVAIKNGVGQYMSTAGTFTTTTETYITTFLNSPGSPGSNFSYTTPPIPAGSYTVYVRGLDQHGFITPVPSVRNVIVTPPASNPPVANFTYSCAANICTFDGRTSTDENAPTLTYAWTFGTATATGPVPMRTFTSTAPVTVTLTVKDEYGLTATTSKVVGVMEPANNVAPTPVINPPSCAGLVCNISGVGSVDSNTGDTFTYLWNFGDGTATSTSSAPSHTFALAGTYTVSLTTTDGWGKAASVTRVVTV